PGAGDPIIARQLRPFIARGNSHVRKLAMNVIRHAMRIDSSRELDHDIRGLSFKLWRQRLAEPQVHEGDGRRCERERIAAAAGDLDAPADELAVLSDFKRAAPPGG